jgi:hypothetical protein
VFAVVTAATPQGVFAATLELQELLGRSFSTASSRSVKKKKKTLSLLSGRGSAPPPGVEVLAVAVTVGWGGSGPDGRSGVAIAASTKDHVYYAGSAEATSVDDGTLVWRAEWCTSADMTGGAVDWPPAPRSGLWFEEVLITQQQQQPQKTTTTTAAAAESQTAAAGLLGSNSGKTNSKTNSKSTVVNSVPTSGSKEAHLLLPKLWIGGELGLQELSLQYKTFRRLDGPSQGLPFENVTAIQTTANRGSGGLGGGVGDLFVGTTMGVARRLAGRPRTWRYYFGARWLPGADGTVRHLTTAREGELSINHVCVSNKS